jgi:two-component system, sensor histidine kinase and response regulator
MEAARKELEQANIAAA